MSYLEKLGEISEKFLNQNENTINLTVPKELYPTKKGLIKFFHPPRSFGHTAGITCLDISLDKKYLISGSYDKTIKLWDFKRGCHLYTFRSHSDVVDAVLFCDQMNVILSGAQDSIINIWDLETRALKDSIQTFRRGFVKRLQLLKKKGDLFIEMYDAYEPYAWIEIWDLKNLKLKKIIDIGLNSFQISKLTPSENFLIGSINFGTGVVIIDISSGNIVKKFVDLVDPPQYDGGEPDSIIDIVCSPDESFFYIHTYFNLIKKINFHSGDILNSTKIRGLGFLEIIPPEKLLIKIGNQFEVRDLNTLSFIRRFEISHEEIHSLIFTPDYKSIISASTQIKVYDLEKGILLKTLGKGSFMCYTEIVKDNKAISIVDDEIYYWDFLSGDLINKVKIENRTIEPHTSMNGRYFSTYLDTPYFSGADIWDLKKLEIINHINDYFINDFNYEGDLIACHPYIDFSLYSWSNEQKKGLIVILKVPSCEIFSSFKIHEDDIIDAKFSPKKRLIASLSRDNTIKIWDYKTGKIMKTIKDCNNIKKLCFSPNGKCIVGCDKWGSYIFWDVSTGKKIKTIQNFKDYSTPPCFSKKGEYIAYTIGDNDVVVKNLKNELSYGPFTHPSSIDKIAFVENDDILITITHSGNLFLWNYHMF
ncbi:MAG: WD40 repeat domain-containing protein [Promethearchaeota archaeon]